MNGRPYHRWNFEATDSAVRVCNEDHEKGQPCEYRELSPAELVAIIETLRSVNNKQSAMLLEAVKAARDLLPFRGHMRGCADPETDFCTCGMRAAKNTAQRVIDDYIKQWSPAPGISIPLTQ